MRDDHELMRRFANGDDGAFDSLMRHWEPQVTRTVRRFTRDSAEAADVTQEVFLRVFRHRSHYDRERAAFSTWLYQIVLNLLRDRAKRKRPELLKLDTDVRDDQIVLPDQKMAKDEVARKINEALLTLPLSLQEILILKHTSDLTFQQIADVLSQPVSTVKTRAKQGLRQLGRELKKRGVEETEIES